MKDRLVSYLYAFVFIIVLTFLLPRLLPGDPLQAIYGDEALMFMSDELKQELVNSMALDKPLIVQFGTYLLTLVKADLGYSYALNIPVGEAVIKALPWTLLLVGSSLFFSTVLGLFLGIEAGWKKGKKTDRVILYSTVVLSGLPNFLIGVLLLLFFSVQLGWLPLGGAVTPYSNFHGFKLFQDIIRHAVLPVAALTLAQLGETVMLTRSAMLSILDAPYILTAAAKGVKEHIVRYRHAGRNSLLPVIARLGVAVGRGVAGALFIEMIFSYPGMGTLTYNALLSRDYPLLQGIFLVLAVVIISANLVSDLVVMKMDPRIKKV
ncbi:MAG: ABC transporter permease [Eubacteriales bacterium]